MDHYSRLFWLVKESWIFWKFYHTRESPGTFGRIFSFSWLSEASSDGIMKEENRERTPNNSVGGTKKGVQDGIDKNANCWFWNLTIKLECGTVWPLRLEGSEELEAAGVSWPRQRLEFRAGNQSHATKIALAPGSLMWGYLTKGWTIILNYLLELQETDPDRPSSSLVSAMFLKKLSHTILQVQDSD